MTRFCCFDPADAASDPAELVGADGSGSPGFEGEPLTVATTSTPEEYAAAVSDALQPYFVTIILILAMILGCHISKALNWFKW